MRQSGILLHITSLPSPGGIGTLGKEARSFIDFLSASSCRIWQMLPIGPTGYGDSPYQSPSTFAGNPLMIDIPSLVEDGFLPKSEKMTLPDTDRTDFDAVRSEKERLLNLSFHYAASDLKDRIADFKNQNFWLRDFCLFEAIKETKEYASWMQWPQQIRMRERSTLQPLRRELAKRIEYYAFVQYLFFLQWQKLKEYAQEKGVSLFGDMPIYVAEDSSDTWSSPELFQFDEERRPVSVAGVPPDYFSEDGQLWGNPLYRWQDMAKGRYSWWIRRLQSAGSRFDMIRIDHFIGFANYYSIPAGAPNAKQGTWVDGPGEHFFRTVQRRLPHLRIIAEDLGAVNEKVLSLLRFCGYPGMKVLQFAFSGEADNPHLPQCYPENCIAYTGTHDNDTSLGWYRNAPTSAQELACSVTGAAGEEDITSRMIQTVFASRADTAIVPMQDLLGLGSEGRMNVPGVAAGNWRWRMTAMPTDRIQSTLSQLNASSRRG